MRGNIPGYIASTKQRCSVVFEESLVEVGSAGGIVLLKYRLVCQPESRDRLRFEQFGSTNR